MAEEPIEELEPDAESADMRPDPQKGGCLNMGWGCLPVIAAILVLPTYFY